jgi:hypothetical protein
MDRSGDIPLRLSDQLAGFYRAALLHQRYRRLAQVLGKRKNDLWRGGQPFDCQVFGNLFFFWGMDTATE